MQMGLPNRFRCTNMSCKILRANAWFAFVVLRTACCVAYCLFKIIWKKWIVPQFITSPNQKWDSNEVVTMLPLRNSNFTVGLLFLGQFPHVSLQWWRSALLLAGEGVNHICYKKRSSLLQEKTRHSVWNNFNDTNDADREPEIRFIYLSSNQHARKISSGIYA